jgi:hypothetical protein
MDCGKEILDPDERSTVERQLGRKIRGEVWAVSRCPFGMVQVIATPPFLPDGTPFPTLYWLTCPLLRREVGRLEGGGFRDEIRRCLEENPGLAEDLRRAEEDYRREREEWAERMGMRREAVMCFAGREGVGGTVRGGLKCLHAHLAHFLAGGRNPVGALVAERLEGKQKRSCRGDCTPFLGGKKRA